MYICVYTCKGKWIHHLNAAFLGLLFGKGLHGVDVRAMLDPTIFKSIAYLKEHKSTIEGEGFTFTASATIDIPEYMFKARNVQDVESKVHGAQIAVTEHNLDEYIDLLAARWLDRWQQSRADQISALKSGLTKTRFAKSSTEP